MIIRRLIVPLSVAVFTAHAGQALAQGAFPAPLPSGAAAPAQAGTVNDPAFPPVRGTGTVNDPAFPAVNGAAPAASSASPMRSSFPVNGAAPLAGAGLGSAPAPGPQGSTAVMQQCMKEFIPLRGEAEKRGKLLQAASAKHVGPDVACNLIKSYGAAEMKMISYVESHGSKCGIPPQVNEQLKKGHQNTENMTQKVCGVAQQAAARGAGPSLSDMLGTSTAVPEATKTKKGGSTFDTLNGNVLTR